MRHRSRRRRGEIYLGAGMLPFWLSIGLLSVCQGGLVALPARPTRRRCVRLRDRRWALILPLSVVGFVLVARAAEHASAQGLTLPRAGRRARRSPRARSAAHARRAPARARCSCRRCSRSRGPTRGAIPGKAAALVLSGAQLRRARRAARGRHAAALARRRDPRDGARRPGLVISDLLQRRTARSTRRIRRPGCRGCRARCSAPRVMGYGDLFIAAALRRAARARRGRSACSCARRCPRRPRSRSASTCCSSSWTSCRRPCRSRSRWSRAGVRRRRSAPMRFDASACSGRRAAPSRPARRGLVRRLDRPARPAEP